MPSKKVWINPDCGLKTRGIPETKESLIRLVEAAKAARENCKIRISQEALFGQSVCFTWILEIQLSTKKSTRKG